MTMVLMFMMPLMLAISSLYYVLGHLHDASEMNGSDFDFYFSSDTGEDTHLMDAKVMLPLLNIYI